jgi:predicted metal-dependent hydrolase
LSTREEHSYLVAGSRLFNRREYYKGHDEWEEVWRRATGARRRLLHGLIQVAVGYEHLKRGNMRGMRSLLRQGAAKLRHFTRRPGVRELRDRALRDAEKAATGELLTLASVKPPRLLVTLEGHQARPPERAIRIEVPADRQGSLGTSVRRSE